MSHFFPFSILYPYTQIKLIQSQLNLEVSLLFIICNILEIGIKTYILPTLACYKVDYIVGTSNYIINSTWDLKCHLIKSRIPKIVCSSFKIGV